MLLSRMIVFIQLKEQITTLSPFDWLCYQRSRRTQKHFEAIFGKLEDLHSQFVDALFKKLEQVLRTFILIFDESQQLLQKLVGDYHSAPPYDGISDNKFLYPRTLFSFIARFIVDYNSIWCGTHMRIRNMELFASAAGGKPDEVLVFTDFNYFTPVHIAYLLKKFLTCTIENSPLFVEMCHYLQGRPRFISQYLINLVSSSVKTCDDIMKISETTFKDYRDSLISSQSSYFGSLHTFWKDRYSAVIGSFSADKTSEQHVVVSDLLLKCCTSSMFSDPPGHIEFDPETADMVSTGLVMISQDAQKYRCYMAEPMALRAGLNYFKAQGPNVIMGYFSTKLFTSVTNPLNPSAQERGNLMELAIAVRFLQHWWAEPWCKQYLPAFTSSTLAPLGVIDCRNAKDKILNYFLNSLEVPTFPSLILPQTKAAPDISYSVFKCYVKTTWSPNSKSSMYVDSESCKANIETMNPKNWYKSSPNFFDKCQSILTETQPSFVHMRFELPFTAPTSPFESTKSDTDDNTICIDLSKAFAREFFGKTFFDKYVEFVEMNVEDKSKLNFAK